MLVTTAIRQRPCARDRARSTPTVTLVVALLLLSFAACEEGDGLSNAGGGSLLCSPGSASDCECDNGLSGSRACGGDNRWGDCFCSSGGGDVVDDAGDIRDNGEFWTSDTSADDWEDNWDNNGDDDSTCWADCSWHQCGPDGCGGVCGYCGEGMVCSDGECMPDMVCYPDCFEKTCGDDGCGGSCGSCGAGSFCDGEMCVGGGACENGDDLSALMEQEHEVYSVSSDCAMGCIGQDASCNSACIGMQLGISDACADCFGQQVDCLIQNCLGQCVTDPESEACLACQNEHCMWAFCECAGMVTEGCNAP